MFVSFPLRIRKWVDYLISMLGNSFDFVITSWSINQDSMDAITSFLKHKALGTFQVFLVIKNSIKIFKIE